MPPWVIDGPSSTTSTHLSRTISGFSSVAGGQGDGGLAHHARMVYITVSEDGLIDGFFTTQGLQLGFVDNRDAIGIGIALAGKGRRVTTSRDLRHLGRGESDDPALRIIAIRHIEVMEVSTSCPHDDNVGRFSGVRHAPQMFGVVSFWNTTLRYINPRRRLKLAAKP